MANKNQISWQVNLGSATYNFLLDYPERGNKSFRLSTDGGSLLAEFPRKWTGAYIGYEIPFTLDGRELCLVVSPNGKNVDIVENGIYLTTGKVYVPTPKWIFVFLVPIIPLIFLGGVIGALMGLAGFGLCTLVARTSLNAPVRFILCILATAVAYVIYFAIAGLVNSALF